MAVEEAIFLTKLPLKFIQSIEDELKKKNLTKTSL